MKLSNFYQVQQIDDDIQQLLGDLSTLYETREKLRNDSSTSKKAKRVTLKSLNKFDLSQIDLTLQD